MWRLVARFSFPTLNQSPQNNPKRTHDTCTPEVYLFARHWTFLFEMLSSLQVVTDQINLGWGLPQPSNCGKMFTVFLKGSFKIQKLHGIGIQWDPWAQIPQHPSVTWTEAGVYHNCSTRFADGFRYGGGTPEFQPKLHGLPRCGLLELL